MSKGSTLHWTACLSLLVELQLHSFLTCSTRWTLLLCVPQDALTVGKKAPCVERTSGEVVPSVGVDGEQRETTVPVGGNPHSPVALP